VEKIKSENIKADSVDKKLAIIRKRVIIGSIFMFIALCSELISISSPKILMVFIAFIMTLVVSILGYYFFKAIYYRK